MSHFSGAAAHRQRYHGRCFPGAGRTPAVRSRSIASLGHPFLGIRRGDVEVPSAAGLARFFLPSGTAEAG